MYGMYSFDKPILKSLSAFEAPVELKKTPLETTQERIIMSDSTSGDCRWNAYMKKYNSRKKQEIEERLNKVELRYGAETKLYDAADINNILIEYIRILCHICDLNENVINADELLNKLKYNQGNIYKTSIILQDAVKSIIAMR